MTAAQRDVDSEERAPVMTAAEEPFVLREQVVERLAAHRARRTHPSPAAPVASAKPHSSPRSRSAEIAAAVARRYAQSPTYRSVLAEESARSVREAEAAAEIANINARAIARAQQHLLAELGEWGEQTAAQLPAHEVPLAGPLPAPEPARAAAAIMFAQQRARAGLDGAASQPASPAAQVAAPDRLAHEALGRDLSPARSEPQSHQPLVISEVQRAGLTVRLIEDIPAPVYDAHRPAALGDSLEAMEQEAMLLDDEILFRNDPSFDETRAPEPIPANLIEFPRQLVAPRKARPRHAEGPLREDTATDPAQLRIFEVEAQHISVASPVDAAPTEWSSILLPAQPATTYFDPVESDYAPLLVPRTAPVSRRLMAGMLDASLITMGTLAGIAIFVLTVTYLTHEPLTIPRLVAAGVAGAAVFVFAAVYHILFFTFADSTPGMRYARIALCTLNDENPSRAAMRRRLLAMALSAIPLGMGYVWALLDDDRLGWHDRISRMYQRAY